MSSELFDVLKDFGLTDYEARVMEALLMNDSLSPGEIVSISGIPQPRVYDVLGKLKEKGMVDESPGKKKVYRARDIEASLGMRVKELNNGIGRIRKIVQKNRSADSTSKPYLWLMETERVIINEMRKRIDNAKDEIIISCSKTRLIKMRESLITAISRGVTVAIVLFPEPDKRLLDDFKGSIIKVRNGMTSEVLITDRSVAIISIGKTMERKDYAVLNEEDEIIHITGYFFYHTIWDPSYYYSTPENLSKHRFRTMWLLCDALNKTYNVPEGIRCRLTGWRNGTEITVSGTINRVEIVNGLRHSIYVTRGKKTYSVGGKTARDEEIALKKIEILN
jgi:sugar-specific transcriptional regulator TrmB